MWSYWSTCIPYIGKFLRPIVFANLANGPNSQTFLLRKFIFKYNVGCSIISTHDIVIKWQNSERWQKPFVAWYLKLQLLLILVVFLWFQWKSLSRNLLCKNFDPYFDSDSLDILVAKLLQCTICRYCVFTCPTLFLFPCQVPADSHGSVQHVTLSRVPVNVLPRLLSWFNQVKHLECHHICSPQEVQCVHVYSVACDAVVFCTNQYLTVFWLWTL